MLCRTCDQELYICNCDCGDYDSPSDYENPIQAHPEDFDIFQLLSFVEPSSDGAEQMDKAASQKNRRA